MALEHYKHLKREVDVAGVCFYEGDPMFHLAGGINFPTCGYVKREEELTVGQFPYHMVSCNQCFGAKHGPVKPIETETTYDDPHEGDNEVDDD